MQNRGAPRQTAQARAHLVDSLGKGVDTLLNRKVLNLTHGKDSWPAEVTAEMQSGDEAAYYDGKAWVDLDAAHPDRLTAVVLHGIGEHYGLAKMLGPRAYMDL